jgi:hypothetical protein
MDKLLECLMEVMKEKLMHFRLLGNFYFCYFFCYFLLFFFREGEHFASGGEDKVVKLWGYDEGINYYIGIGHSGAITRVLFFFFFIIVLFLFIFI